MEINLVLTAEDYNKHFDIIVENQKIGRILFREGQSWINIESINIDTDYQKKGIGKTLIKELLLKYGAIYGCSSPLAIGFWEKLGAKFEYKVTERMVYHLLDIGEYPPFEIINN